MTWYVCLSNKFVLYLLAYAVSTTGKQCRSTVQKVVIVGSNLTLNCEYAATRSRWDYYAVGRKTPGTLFNGNNLSDKDSVKHIVSSIMNPNDINHTRPVLSIVNVQLSYAGTYQCVNTKDDTGRVSNCIEVHVVGM